MEDKKVIDMPMMEQYLNDSLGIRTREPSEVARRSMREQEEQIAALHKENFNLKLRVYFLEERDVGSAGNDACSKENIELKIEIEALKHDLDSKQELIHQAAKAIEIMEDNQKEATKDFEKKQQLYQNRILELEDELKTCSSESTLNNKALLCDSCADINEELCRKQSAIHDLENKIYELQTEISTRNHAYSKVQKKLEEQSVSLNNQQTLLEQKDLDITQHQMKITNYRIQVQELKEILEAKENELKLFQEQLTVTANNMMVPVEPNLITEAYALNDTTEVRHLHDILAKRNNVIKKHEEAHRCACRVIQIFMQKNKEMTRQIEGFKRQNVDISNTLPLPPCDTQTSSNCASANVSPRFPARSPSYADMYLSEDARHERENENRCEQNTIELLENFYKICLQTKGDTAVGPDNISSQNYHLSQHSPRPKEQQILNKDMFQEANGAVSLSEEYSQVVEENRKLLLQIEDLRTELRNTPERENDNTIKHLRKELIQCKADYDRMKTDMQEMQISLDNLNTDNLHWQNVCMTLKEHLEELAGFLKSLLRSDVNMSIVDEKKKIIKQAVDKSLDLSRSVALSISSVGRDGASLIQLSSLSAFLDTSSHSGIEKLNNNSALDNVIMDQAETIANLRNDISYLKKQLNGKHSKKQNQLDIDLSESEAWSEPDKKVSLSRIGLQDLSSISPRRKSNSFKNTHKICSRKILSDESHEGDEIAKLHDNVKDLELHISESDKKLLESECALLKADNEYKQEKLRMVAQLEKYRLEKIESDDKIKDILSKLLSKEAVISKLQEEIKDLTLSICEQRRINMEYEHQLKLMDEKLEILQTEKDCKEVDVKIAEDNLSHLQSDMKEMMEKFADLNRTKDRISSSLTESLQVNDELCEQIKSLREEKRIHTEEQLRQINDLKRKYNSNLDQNWVSRKDYEAKCADLEKVLLALKEKEKLLCALEKSEEKKLRNIENEYQGRLLETKLKESQLLNNVLEKEKECKLVSREIDTITLQMSQITIDRTRISNEKLKLEKELILVKSQNEKALDEMQLRISELERAYAEVQNKLVTLQTMENSKKENVISRGTSSNSSDEGRHDVDRLSVSSPDLGIESDQGNASATELESIERPLLKSLELTESMSNILDFEKQESVTQVERIAVLEKENVELRKKLVRMRRTLEEALNQILAANKRKKQVEKDITAQLCKTHGVLKQVRTNLESGSNSNK